MADFLYERLSKYRKRIGLSQLEAAEKLEIHVQTLSKYERGERIPPAEVLSRMAELYRSSIDELYSSNIVSEPNPVYDVTNRIPVLGKIPAGFPMNLPEQYIQEYIHVPDAPPNAYCIQVKGNSMLPELREGEYVLFAKASTAESGQIVIALDEFGDAMIKRFKKNNGEIFLVSDNPEYRPIAWRKEFKIVGIAVKVVSVRKL